MRSKWRKSHRRSLIVFFVILLMGIEMSIWAREKFEPPDGRIIHGLGQYIAVLYSDAENWQYVTEYQNAINQVPVIYSVYAAIDPFLDALDNTDFVDITTQHTYPYVLVVGITLFDSLYLINGTTNIPVDEILNGSLDYRIIDIAQRIKAVDVPVFVRPGFEFGWGNSGIHNDPDVTPADFVNIWIHIYTIFQQQFVTNVAWVWNTVNPNQFNYMEWYPGDEYVDWWGINYFSLSQINNADNFLDDAALHGKPVIVCESNPIHNGGTTNAANWDDWFVPYFTKIKDTPHIKIFVYISDPWDRGPFASWPDSRITSNETIRANYENEMLDSLYIHMPEYLVDPLDIVGDYVPPSSVANFTATPIPQYVQLTWQIPTDADFAGTRILRKTDDYPAYPEDGDLVYEGADTSFVDLNVNADTTYYYAAFSYDTIPNYAEPTLAMAMPGDPTGISTNSVNSDAAGVSFSCSPNPFNSTTNIQWNLSFSADVDISVYNVLGERSATLLKKRLMPGKASVTWNAGEFASGVYFLVLTINPNSVIFPGRTGNEGISSSPQQQVHVLKTILIK